MGKRNGVTGSEHKQAFAKLVEQNAQKHSKQEVFSDFCEMSAISISNAVDRTRRDEREARYLDIAKRYNTDELNRFAEMLAHVVLELETGFSDVLGSLFMQLALGDSWKGQFFTPYEVSYLMAALTYEDVTEQIKHQGFVQINEPCVGAGGMAIASADVLQKQGINYQQHLHVAATDLDKRACHMAYIQLALLHVPAIVTHGNALCPEAQTYSHWFTPAHVLGQWDEKLKIRWFVDAFTERCSQSAAIAPRTSVTPTEYQSAIDVIKTDSQAAQLSLFDDPLDCTQ
ncbi:N-6 DNA methylase [Chitinimonas sp. BJB300]|uniref:N-6 DNA methylase n=1 Tax=Chitinimonas sp. BJB300 TaxID=1559339 RepID=UPI000C1056C3|nr:N-6 DNA methylase [Chitinimonas sp. BJB300]PHV10033.1 type I restriction endonuclease subunit M [Chitinimonas sp. BJB300]TSJ83259.1 SAM-dependent DNA methyltransferase [Chitinimonas sp. BJB300]